jgi:signal peptide peptidase SppA
MTERMRLKLPGIRRAVQETAWAIQESKLEAMVEVLELHAAGGAFTREEIQARVGDRAKPISRVQGAIAVLPLFGVLSQRMDMLSEMSGGTSTERFAREFDQLMADESIGAIVLQIDSPGGNVAGTPEVARKIFEARGKGKAIIAQADSLMASAAYYIGAAADEIVANPSAEVGSIGVYAVHLDASGYNEKEGFKYTLIKAGKYKAEGNPYGALSDEALAAAQEKVDQYYGMFVRDVAKFRGVSVEDVRNGYGQGRALLAKQAHDAGMIERVATLEETLTRLGGKKGASTARASAKDRSVITIATAADRDVPSEGGFLVPPQFSSKIWDEQASMSTTTSRDDGQLHRRGRVAHDERERGDQSRATGSRFGGIQGYWINEADQITKSKPKFRQLRLEPQELAV